MAEIPKSNIAPVASEATGRSFGNMADSARNIRSIRIADQTIGDGRTYIIAEAGVNHNGDMKIARELVRAAKGCGADCVKFQTFMAERVVTRAAPKAAYQLELTDRTESQYEMLKKLELTPVQHKELFATCAEEGITFLSTPYSLEDAEMLCELGVGAFKIASGQLVEFPLLAAIARFGKPMVISTGMADMAEIAEAVATIRSVGNGDIIVLQCTTNYPTRLADVNLRTMRTIGRECGVITGYSDHTEGILACVGATALGAALIEKHFTMDRTLPGPDHKCSADPVTFAELVRGVRGVELALGDGVKRPTSAEVANTVGMRRSIVARRFIARGERITAKDFAFKRPATGLAPRHLAKLENLVSRCDIQPDTQVSLEMFE